MTLSSVAIASKWDEPEKIKVFIVSTVGRKVLQSRKGERHNCTVWCNTGVEFSFNDIMYKQTDGVAMGSPLGPALANIFVGFYEEKLFSQKSKPSTYFRYVDDTFAMFRNEEESDNFFKQLNCLHPSLKFTFEKEKNNCLPFLDVNV